MLRRPCTAITLTIDDIAAYEERRERAAKAAAFEAGRNFTQESTEDKSHSNGSQSWNSQATQEQSPMTPDAQILGRRDQNVSVDESMMDTDDNDSVAFQGGSQPQDSVFTPPNAPIRESTNQARQRSRAERIGLGR